MGFFFLIVYDFPNEVHNENPNNAKNTLILQ